MSKRRKSIRVAQYIFIGLVTLVFSCYFALQMPAVQTWLAHRLSDYLSGEWNTRVMVGRVKIDLWANLYATDIYVEDQKGDSLLYAGGHWQADAALGGDANYKDDNQPFEVDEQHNTSTTPEKKHCKSEEKDSPEDTPLTEFLTTPSQKKVDDD